jgi:hypothetical protein
MVGVRLDWQHLVGIGPVAAVGQPPKPIGAEGSQSARRIGHDEVLACALYLGGRQRHRRHDRQRRIQATSHTGQHCCPTSSALAVRSPCKPPGAAYIPSLQRCISTEPDPASSV